MLGLEGAVSALTDPNGPIAQQAQASAALAGALAASNEGNAFLAKSNFALAESNNRLAQALEDSTRKARA
jgi:hypothetical protein